MDIGTLYTLYGLLNQLSINATIAGNFDDAATFDALAFRVRGHIQVAGYPSALGPEMTLTTTDNKKMDSLAYQVGGKAVLNALPATTIALALNHGDDVIGVSVTQMSFEIPDLDTAGGYAVYDIEYDQVYAENSSTGLTSTIWGTRPQDVAWYLNAEFGVFAWLHYSTTVGTERVIGLIRV